MLRMELKKNDIKESEIIDYTVEGSGVCRIDGRAVFVPNTAVGDRLRVRILKATKKAAYGKAEEILVPSDDRIIPDCDVFMKCGGCCFRHISYASELDFKQKRVCDALTRIGGIDKSLIQKIKGSDNTEHYRNKAQLPVTRDRDGRIRVGFFAAASHRVIPLDRCMLHAEPFDRTIKIFLTWANKYNIEPYDEKTHSGVLRHLYLRFAEKTGELMVCVIINKKSLPYSDELVEMLRELPELKTAVLNINTERTNVITGKKCINLYGDGYITDELCGLRFRISPLSFYQVNRTQAERLYGIARELAELNKDETLLDLYCGTGTIGLSMAKNAKHLIGAEIIEQAVKDARINAEANGIDNAEFICADSGKAAQMLRDRNEKPDCIIVDPPRKGCSEEVIRTIAEMEPARVVYVSCDPATLARDIKLFEETGYKVQTAVPVDMFPRTGHVECVVLMTKCE